MLIHASCAAKDGAGVLLSGPAGAGKSDLVLQLLERGFALVADDQVLLEDGVARAPAALAGLLEVRGLGIVRMRYVERARVVLAVRLGSGGERLPAPALLFGVPVVALDGRGASAAAKVVVALECVREPGRMLVGGLVA